MNNSREENLQRLLSLAFYNSLGKNEINAFNNLSIQAFRI